MVSDYWIEAEHHVSVTLSNPEQLKQLADEMRTMLSGNDIPKLRNMRALLDVLTGLGF